MFSLFLKEIKSFFNSLTGYIVIVVFLLMNSLFMWVFDGPMNIPEGGYATLETLFFIAPWVFLMLIPAITMRSFAEEKRSGTLDLLLTRPISGLQITGAKYLASVLLVVFALLPTLVWYFSVIILGNPVGNIDHGGTWGSYAGLLMLACAYTAIGIFCSSLTDNPLISFLLAAILCLFFCYGFDQIANLFPSGKVGNMIISLGIMDHYQSMSRGVIDTRDILYFLAFITLFLLMTRTSLGYKKRQVKGWKKVTDFRNPIVKMGVAIVLIIVIARALAFLHYRFDLTSEKRYTLSAFTRESLQNLDDEVKIQVYLGGDLNIPFHKMEQRLKETLEEFRVYGGSRFSFEFINPFSGSDAKAKDKLLNDLVEKGLKPTNILDKDREGGSSEKLVIPGAILQYKDAEIPVNLLKNNPGSTAEENINSSMEAFEFELMRAIGALVADSTEKVAFIEGHGEFDEFQVGDISRELGWNFQVDRGSIDGKPGILNQYKAVIVAGPTEIFNERDKFVLDQYLMQGGKILWFVDMVNASLDSISKGNASMAMIRTLNIEDLLFRYGVRINPVLVQDVQCAMIPVNVALAGNTPDFRPAPWLYSPLLAAPASNPITRNLNSVKAEFAGCIDTIEARKGIRKTALLRTSQFSRQVAAPVIISLDEVRLTPQERDFNNKFLPVGVLLEGSFESAFRNRMISELFPDTAVQVTETGNQSSILVVADADIIRNGIRPTPQGVLITPLGYDRLSSQTYGNKEFIMNAIQYMTGNTGLISLRSRELSIRLLDKTELKNNRNKWILLNTLLPPLIIFLAGLIYTWLRKRKYSGV